LIAEAVRWTSRSVLSVLRSVPEIVWAYLFVRILGLGPGPAVIAIGLSFAGIIGKLYAELLESVDAAPVRALRAAGVGWIGSLTYGALPQVGSQWVGYGLFRLECAVRSASILGVVGAGGIGAELALSIRYFQYDKLATALLAVLGCIIALELLSALLRRLRPMVTLIAACAATAWGISLLEIPWEELLAPSAMEQARLFIDAFSEPTTDSEFLWHSWNLALETLAMAFAGTGIAALIAFVLAPMATSSLTVFGFLPDAPRGSWLWRVPAMVLLLGTRLLFQVTRALPELVWALIFIVWVGPGAFAGALAVGAHTIGILGRLFGETYEEVEPAPVAALEAIGVGAFGRWLVGVLPQVAPRILAFALFRFEVNVRATAMVGFVGAGGIGDALHTAISLFHMSDLATLLLVLFAMVIVVDAVGDRLRAILLKQR
ncbi:MAG: phosphonate transport system permease protein, partial [Myxococcota bacterium]